MLVRRKPQLPRMQHQLKRFSWLVSPNFPAYTVSQSCHAFCDLCHAMVLFKKPCTAARRFTPPWMSRGGDLSRNIVRGVKPPSPPILRPECWRQRIGRWRGYCRAFCQPRMGGDPIASIFFRSEFPKMMDGAAGPRDPYAPNRPLSHRR
jgi:hypothetical protein